ncbi:MAG: RNA-binding protein [Bacteriovoracaceae bacterium]|nr:RNA-binding protein [Bacteriovoracaceae bacterium]
MTNKLYVGNVSFDAKESDLEDLFSQFGTVNSVRVITDRMTGRSKGFAFVEMGTSEEAKKAIDELDGKEAFGRDLKVNEAQEKERGGRDDRSGGGGGYNRNW